MADSFNGFSVLMDYPGASGQFTSPEEGFKQVYTRNRAFAVVLEYMARRYHEEVEKIVPSHRDNWFKPRERNSLTLAGNWTPIGVHCYRPPNSQVGTGNQSNHRSGSAIDINGHLHPYEASVLAAGRVYNDGYTQSQRDKIREITNSVRDSNGRIIGRTGLDFAKGKRDGMHLEIGVDYGKTLPTQMQVNQAAKKLEAFVGRSSTAHTWFKNAKGLDVQDFQKQAKLKGFKITYVDGKAGDETDAAIRALQRAMGIAVDGKVGTATRTALKNYKVPEPVPVIPEVPDMSDYRISGKSRYETSAMGVAEFPSERIILAATEIDASLAASWQAGAVLLVPENATELPEATIEVLLEVKPTQIIASGGSTRVSDELLYKARKLVGLET